MEENFELESESESESEISNSTGSDTDSATRTFMKFVNLKSKDKPDFDTVAYSLEQTIKVGNLKTEVARLEECIGILQNDYNNLKHEFKEQHETVKKQKNIINIFFYCTNSMIVSSLVYNIVNGLRN